MIELLWLVPAFPFLGYIFLALFGRKMPAPVVSAVGIGSIGLSALAALAVAIDFISNYPHVGFYIQTLWTWIGVSSFTPAIAFRLDSLSVVMMLVVTFVSFLIHLYSADYMRGDEGYSRFFAYMNLFVGSMLVLVLAENLLLLYLGWEGVGLCSYLLIGFWYRESANGAAAQKAFIVTRIGDTAMALGLFLLFTQLGSLDIQRILAAAPQFWPAGSTMAIAAAALLLGGAVGKSAQLPLQTWLPDAMAGPTPVSALIHAATMVTAGVYLIARMHIIFDLAPPVQTVVAIIGALTLLLAGFSAMVQTDIKRVLAYSTMSQIGYMFLALGVGAYSAAIFHFMTHAFFKALLFMAAGVVILSLRHEQNMFKMGGLRHQLPLTFWVFLVGCASLSAVPLITAGFYSKDMILWDVWISDKGSFWLWLAGAVGAMITAFYSFRMLFITFYGAAYTQSEKVATLRSKIPLVILAVLSIIAGFVEIPRTLGHYTLFSDFLRPVLPQIEELHRGISNELVFQIITTLIALSGIYLAYLAYMRRPDLVRKLSGSKMGAKVAQFWRGGWGFDWLYYGIFVWPYIWIARINRDDFIDWLYQGMALAGRQANVIFSRTQTGNVRLYAAGIALGAVIIVAIVVLL